MSENSSEDGAPADAVPSLPENLLRLLSILEQWRAECNGRDLKSPHGFPETNTKRLVQGLVLYGLGGLASLETSFLKETRSFSAILILLVIVISTTSVGTVLFLMAFGIFKKQYWKAVLSMFRPSTKPRDNYPFTQLKRRLEDDTKLSVQLASFDSDVLIFANKRLGYDEAESRDRLTSLLGNAPAALMVGSLPAIPAAWQSMRQNFNMLTAVILAASVGALFLSAYVLNMRLALFDVVRSRTAIDLELERRGTR